MSNELVPFEAIQRMADVAAKSKLFGNNLTADQAMTIMLIAQAEGRHPMSAAKDYDIIQGKPAKKAEAMLRDFLAAGGTVQWHQLDDSGAKATFTHPQGGTVTIDWNEARMKKAGITNNAMYTKYPRAMYRSRCVSEGVRTVCPSATGGLYVPEEVRAFAPEKNMGDAVVVQPDSAPAPSAGHSSSPHGAGHEDAGALLINADMAVAIEDRLKETGVSKERMLKAIGKKYSAPISRIAQIRLEDFDRTLTWIDTVAEGAKS